MNTPCVMTDHQADIDHCILQSKIDAAVLLHLKYKQLRVEVNRKKMLRLMLQSEWLISKETFFKLKICGLKTRGASNQERLMMACLL